MPRKSTEGLSQRLSEAGRAGPRTRIVPTPQLDNKPLFGLVVLLTPNQQYLTPEFSAGLVKFRILSGVR